MRACDYKVYKINYTDRQSVRDNDGDFIRWIENVKYEYLCVAPDENFAMVAFKRYHSGEHVKNIELSLIGQLDDLVYLQ